MKIDFRENKVHWMYDFSHHILLTVLSMIRPIPRASISFAKKHFKQKEVVAAEIGVAYGSNALSMFMELQIKQFYAIDPYVDYTDNGSTIRHEKIHAEDSQLNYAKNILKKHSRKIIWVRGFSADVVDRIPNDIDFVYIDGNHSYDFVKKDIELYYPKIKEGGIIGGHDFDGYCPEVARAVLDFQKENNLKLYGKDSDWWIVK